jgi:diguanylate cyclase (GGDEF)-like protein/PAS domain S-box-containing protein
VSEGDPRTSAALAALSSALARAAAGDLAARAPRDGSEDALDALARLVNGALADLETLTADRERRLREDRERLDLLVAERTRQFVANQDSLRRLFDAAPVALVMLDAGDDRVVACNERAAQLLRADGGALVGGPPPPFASDDADRAELLARVRRDGVLTAEVRVEARDGSVRWALLEARTLALADRAAVMLGFADIGPQKQSEARLRELATTDPLTGALNRRRLFELATDEVRRSERYGRPLCFAMLDLDHFKAVNDRHGHTAGDEALRTVAAAIRAGLRSHDLLARYGGEEFAVVLPETGLETAVAAMDRIREAIAGLRFDAGGAALRITVSAGVVAWRPGESPGAVLDRADVALYEAKRSGRNRVVAAELARAG